MWRAPISQHILHVHCDVCFWIFPYLEELWNFKNGTPLKKHKIEIPSMVKKQFKVSVNENQMPLEDKNVIHNGTNKCGIVGLNIFVNHSFKGLGPTNLLLPHVIPPNHIFGLELSKETSSPKRKFSFLNVVNLHTREVEWKDQ
jgi:hypothetical protein